MEVVGKLARAKLIWEKRRKFHQLAVEVCKSRSYVEATELALASQSAIAAQIKLVRGRSLG